MEPGPTVAALQKEVVAFRDARDWKQFHNPKDVAISLTLEAAELLETFQWATAEDALKRRRPEIEDELADILYWVLLFAHDVDLDLPAALRRKLKQNEAKYPVEKARGIAKKYTEL